MLFLISAVDGEFMRAALEQKIALRDQLEVLLANGVLPSM